VDATPWEVGRVLRRIAIVVVAALVAVAGSRLPVIAGFDDAAPGLRTVHTAYTDLLTLSYKHPDPVALLQAGWAALPEALPSGAKQPPALPQLPPDAAGAFSAFATAYTAFSQSYQHSTVQAQPELLALAIDDGMVRSVDEQHTNVVITAGLSGLSGDAEWGLGLETTPAPPLIVTAIAPDGPAQAAGAQPGDVILAINGKPPRTERDLVPLIDPTKPPTQIPPVTVSVQRAGKRLDLSIAPGSYAFPLLSSKLLPGNVGYLRLNQFSDKTAYQQNGLQITTDLDRRLDDFDAHGATALILDLRDNGGGSIETAASLLGRFLPEGTLTVREDDGTGQRGSLDMVEGIMHRRQLPLVLLVNDGSASASEITAAVLKENHRAVLVGQKTAGALAIARLLPLDDYAALEVGTSAVATALGSTKVDGVGVQVDVPVEDVRSADDYRSGRDPQLDAALKAVAQAPAPPAYTPPAAPLPSVQAVHGLLAGYVPAVASISGADGDTLLIDRLDGFDNANPSEIAYTDSADPRALLQAMRERGWLGRHTQNLYAVSKNIEAGITVTVDVYTSAAGAAAAIEANDVPAVQQQTTPANSLGDESAGYVGLWFYAGRTSFAWRRGDVVTTVNVDADPGTAARPDLAFATAQQIDTAFQRYPIDGAAFQKGLAGLIAATTATASSAAPAAAGATVANPSSAAVTPGPHSDAVKDAMSQAQTQAGQVASDAALGAKRAVSPTLVLLVGFIAALLLTGGYAFRRR
jgi:carboxyl-terminal processing protease